LFTAFKDGGNSQDRRPAGRTTRDNH